MDDWELGRAVERGADPFVAGGSGARMRTTGGMGVYGIASAGRTKDIALDEWDVVGKTDEEEEEDDWEGKWDEGPGEEDTTTPMGATSTSNTHTHADIETWRRHWEEVERSFSPRRGPGRRLGIARGLDER